MSSPDFYRAFEDRFRGSAPVIESRLAVYLPFVRPVADAHRGATLTDLGCGRGEWLALLERAGIQASGVDKDETMLAACREQGLKVECADAIDYLKRLPDASQLAVSAFHFVEHLPFDSLHAVAREAMRVLRPGGLIILETPNPESLIVSSTDFYNDPSHRQPLPPRLLAFLAEFHGFVDIKVIRLQERRDLPRDGMSLWGVLTGTSPDYAIIARKPGDPPTAEIAGYQQDYGVTLESLAIEYDIAMRKSFAELRERLDAAHALAAGAAQTAKESAELARQAMAASAEAAAAAATAREAQQALEATRAELASAQAQVERERALMQAVLTSRSWRITAPVRWLGAKLRP